MDYTLRHGLNIPIITTLDDSGRIISSEQRRVIRHVAQNGYGADIIFGVGTTGEWNRIENHQRQRLIEIEIDEVRQINAGMRKIEAWVGVNGKTRAETLANLDAAIQLDADAAVIAPLAIEDINETEIVRFFHREITDLIESSNREIPIFLYDNAEISAPGHAPHIRTAIVKHLSRLPWVRGIKVSAPRHVLGNYIKAALHYKQPGEFGIYIGNAMLIFKIYRTSRGLIGRLREGWRDYLLHSTPPIGVVSGPANVMPREWQKSWRVCWAGDDEFTDLYQGLFSNFEKICRFNERGKTVKKTIACLKYALEIDGVISGSTVARGTRVLTDKQKEIFRENYLTLRNFGKSRIDSHWHTRSDLVEAL
jgi:dihydrodipicolinate synthase/N-acetylneuraminate lyase